MTEIAWLEFNRSNQLITKHKIFKTQTAAERFIQKLNQNPNFYQILATR